MLGTFYIGFATNICVNHPTTLGQTNIKLSALMLNGEWIIKFFSARASVDFWWNHDNLFELPKVPNDGAQIKEHAQGSVHRFQVITKFGLKCLTK